MAGIRQNVTEKAVAFMLA